MRGFKEIMWFAGRMLRKLSLNKHKTGWEDISLNRLFTLLCDEKRELSQALNMYIYGYSHERFPQDVIDECTDVANYAMMIADNVRRENGMSVYYGHPKQRFDPEHNKNLKPHVCFPPIPVAPVEDAPFEDMQRMWNEFITKTSPVVPDDEVWVESEDGITKIQLEKKSEAQIFADWVRKNHEIGVRNYQEWENFNVAGWATDDSPFGHRPITVFWFRDGSKFRKEKGKWMVIDNSTVS